MTEQRLTLFPLEHPKIFEFYQKQLACHWVVGEVDLSKDNFDGLSDKEQEFVEHILAFFASADTIVNINLGENFTKEVNILEAEITYRYQMMMEDIHSHMYSILIDTFIKSDERKKKLFNAVKEIGCIKEKADWAFKWINSAKTISFPQRLIAFAIMEGIYFSGSFCAIYWLAQQNKMPGLCKSNEFIARDEGLHTEFACFLYKYIRGRIPEDIVHGMIKDAVEIENKFINEALPCSLLGMNSTLMYQYIKFVADRLVVQLGYKSIYNVKNPFNFMENISLEGKNNFFENRTSEYQKAHVMKQTDNLTFDESEIF